MRIWPSPYWPPEITSNIPDYKFPLHHLLDEAADNFPHQVFTIFQGAQRTYSQVRKAADKTATFLQKSGIRKGDKIAIFLPNLPQYPEILFGIVKAGAVAVLCNPVYTPHELRHQLRDSESRMVFCMDHPEFYPAAVEAIQGTQVENVIVCNIKSYLPKFKALVGGILGKIPKAPRMDTAHLDFDTIQEETPAHPTPVDIDPEKDTTIMLYTGGTTGAPKGAELVHTNFTYNAVAGYEFIRLAQAPKKGPERLHKGGVHTHLGILPWYHTFGLTAGLLSAIISAGRMVCIPDPRAGKPAFTEVLASIEKYRATLMPAVPTLFSVLIHHPRLADFDLSSLMGCFSAGSPLAPEVCRQFEEKTGSVIFEGYGMTETAPVVTLNPTNAKTRKIGSIGFPLPGTWVKILDVNDPRIEKERGQDGEVAACGPQVMKGYWNNSEANDKAFVTIDEDRYFLTGDIGHIDEDGYVHITDRKKDMIIVGGFNVYPRDVEDILYTHPKVELTAVVGIPDAKSGESVKAFIKLKQGEEASEEEIKAFCQEKMTPYKRPRRIEFREEIPTSNVGKVLRRVLKDEETRTTTP